MADKVAYIIMVELTPGMTPESGRDEIRRNVQWGDPQVAMMYIMPDPSEKKEIAETFHEDPGDHQVMGPDGLPASAHVEVEGGPPGPGPFTVPPDGLTSLEGTEGVPVSRVQLNVPGSVEGKVTLGGVVGVGEPPARHGRDHLIGRTGQGNSYAPIRGVDQP